MTSRYKLKNTVSFLVLIITGLIMTTSSYASDRCNAFPANNFHFPADQKSHTSEIQYERMLETFETIMAPKIERHYHKKLILNRDWENSRVNAHATRDSEQNPVITLTGGLARHPLANDLAMYLILCHELGHQFGGAPKQRRGHTDLRSWSSAEGQADYYAASKCMPYLLSKLRKQEHHLLTMMEQQFNNEELKAQSSHLRLVCQTEECLFIASIAETVAHLFYSVRPRGPLPELTQTTGSAVRVTDLGHPTPQCRLETFVAGANCPVPIDKVFDESDPHKVGCPTDQKSPGGRPTCWFNPQRF